MSLGKIFCTVGTEKIVLIIIERLKINLGKKATEKKIHVKPPDLFIFN